MNELLFEFFELESDYSFALLGKTFAATSHKNNLLFNNSIAQGELIKVAPEKGLWIRKWKLTVQKKIVLRQQPTPDQHETKYSLIYFLNPSLFDLKNKNKKIKVSAQNNIMFLSNRLLMDYSVLPKQPFFVVDITFTESWIKEQFNDADFAFKNDLANLLGNGLKTLSVQSCEAEDYIILQDLDHSMQVEKEDNLFIKSRAYNLIGNYLNKALNNKVPEKKQSKIYYDEMIKAEELILQHLQKPIKIVDLASAVNMSVSSLFRQFKNMYGVSIQEFSLQKKMELAKKLILENNATIIKVAESLGYKQPSAFIESFTKYYGCTPGSLKITGESLETA